jgi:uncharacterized membrane protein YhaH (DUF805 family)
MPNPRRARAAYRWWTLLIPIAMVVVGVLLYVFAGPVNVLFGLIGGVIVLVGIFTFSYLLVVVVAVEVAARRLVRRDVTPELLSEEATDTDSPNGEDSRQKS